MPPRITWTTESYTGIVPNHLAQRRLIYDSVSGQWFTYASVLAISSGIYSNAFTWGDASAKVTTLGGGTLSANNSSAPDYPNSTVGQWNNGDGWTPDGPGPSDRHPDFTTCIDTIRNKIVQVTGLAIGHSPNDYWEFDRNVDPTEDAPTQIAVTGITGDGSLINGVLVHDPLHDVFWAMFGNGSVYVMARTTLTADQISAGCATQNVWAAVTPSGSAPAFSPFKNAWWDETLEKILVMSWDNGGGTAAPTTIYTYDVLTKTWTHLDPANKPTNVGASVGFEWLGAKISNGDYAGKYLYIRTGHTYTATPLQAAAFMYDPDTNAWEQCLVTGTGPSRISMLDWDPTIGGVVVHEGTGGQSGQLLHGVLSEDSVITDLMAFYELETDGSDSHTGAGNPYDLSATNSPTDTTGKVGGAQAFNGSVFPNVQTYHHPGNPAALQNGNIDFSYAGWFYVASLAATRYAFARWGSTTATFRSCALEFTTGSNVFRFIASNGTSATDIVSTVTIEANKWYFVAMGHREGTDRLWICVSPEDGALGAIETAVFSSAGVLAGSAFLTLGGLPTGDDGTLIDLGFNGRIDQFGYWKRDISGDLGVLFNGGSGLTYEDMTGEPPPPPLTGRIFRRMIGY